MNVQKEIKQFNAENCPFYIVDHDNGEFSLCLAASFLKGPYADYGQEAFNAYAIEMGEPVADKYGMYTHGNGYEWEAAFKKAFESDPNIGQIKFDCEAGGFFCYTNNLSVLKDFGSRFKMLVEDTPRFTKVVSEGLKAAERQREEFAKIEFKILGRLVQHPDSNFSIRTAQGDVQLTPDIIKGLLDGSTDTLLVGGVQIKAEEFLMQDAYHIQRDLFNRNSYQLITNEAEALQEHQTQDNQQMGGM